jgi:hypothetical protein
VLNYRFVHHIWRWANVYVTEMGAPRSQSVLSGAQENVSQSEKRWYHTVAKRKHKRSIYLATHCFNSLNSRHWWKRIWQYTWFGQALACHQTECLSSRRPHTSTQFCTVDLYGNNTLRLHPHMAASLILWEQWGKQPTQHLIDDLSAVHEWLQRHPW